MFRCISVVESGQNLLKPTFFRMTLQEAIQVVLKANNLPMTAEEIAGEINSQQLHIRNDGKTIPASQIHSRVKDTPNLFYYVDKMKITYHRNAVGDLLNYASKLQGNLENILIRHGIKIKAFHLLVPAFLFFKRMFDNPDQFQKYFGFTLENINGDLAGMIKFYEEINCQASPFKGKTDNLFNDFKHLHEENLNIFEKFEEINLSQKTFSKIEFGQFFNEFLYKVSMQKVEQGMFITPEIIGRLFFKLVEKNITSSSKIYNPGAGYSSIPALFAQNSKSNFKFYGEEIDGEVYLISLMNLILNDINVDSFYNSDSFENDYSNQTVKYDIVICVPPFKGTYFANETTIKYPVKTNDIISLFIQHCVFKLNENGKAIMIVPERILFDNKKEFKELRKFLLENKMLESIISIPAGIFQPYSGLKTSILVLSAKQNSNVVFIDAEKLQLSNKDKTGINNLNIEKIASLFNRENTENLLFEPTVEYGEKLSSVIPIEKINKTDYNFSLRRYQKEEDFNEDQREELFRVLSSYNAGGRTLRNDLMFVNISDLNNSIEDINLDFGSLKNSDNKRDGKFISIPVLLVGSIAPNFKPTYYDQNNGPIIISRNIHAYRVDTTKIDIEYLINELNKKSVEEQINARATGSTSLRKISSTDFLRLRINIPTIEKQKEIVRNIKELIYERKLKEAQKYAPKDAISGKSEKELLGFMKHEIGNITGGITSDVKNLKNFIANKAIELTEKISGRNNAVTLKEVFNRMESNINDVESLMTNIQKIIDIGNSTIQKRPVLFREFIEGELDKLSDIIKVNNVDIYIGINEKYGGKNDKTVLIDRAQFSFVIRNFVLNSIKHGFHENSFRNIVFNLNEDEDFYYLNLINSGEPFAEDFTLQDFLSFGGRTDASKGSGLGGFLMGKVIDNHGGEIEMMESGKSIFLNEPLAGTDIYYDHTLINAGVYFIIKLPKE